MAVRTATQKTGGGSSESCKGRLHLVYVEHQRLEDELNTFRAFAAAARTCDTNAAQTLEGFSPWTGVIESAARCADTTSRCLRLFNPSRRISQFKAMDALAKLYGTGGAPHERVVAFLTHICEAFDGVLPVEIALSGGYSLQKLDPSAADDYLVAYIRNWATLVAAPEEHVDPFRWRFRDLLSGHHTQKTFYLRFRAAVLLQIECAAQSGHHQHISAAYNIQALDAILSPLTREELQRYQVTCLQETARHREVKSAGAAPFAPTGPFSRTSTALVPCKQQGTQRNTSTEVGRGGAVIPSSSGVANWRWNAIRIGVLLLLVVLLRFASGRLTKAVKSALQMTRAAPARHRILTL
ncbi:hypothetical protein LSCM1_04585 [Leishmania martiniquensis]|uniref:Uncharacterized protein n=1 Tax=Leishmania martiniquensis TaxID=1580590 RepID=A0A836KKT6_9TRYP|nr:hypothetical protein LSCM1_04585 [Leishmania martiniquensis]